MMIYLFDIKEKFINLIRHNELKEAIQEENLNGTNRLDLEILLEYKDKLKNAAYIAHRDVTNPNEFYFYRIITCSNTFDSMFVTAIASQFDDLRAYGYLREFRRDNATAREAAEIVFGGSRWEVVQADDTPQKQFYIYDLTRLDALKKLIETYNVELEFKVVITKNKITRRIVKIYNRRGIKVNKRFYYGSNALEVIKEESRQDIVTAVIGRGKGEEKFDTSGEATGGFGRRIDFKEIEWSKEKGNPLDKPIGQEYLELKEATQKYGYSDGTPRFKIVVHDQITTPEELIQACYEDLVRLSRPLVKFKANILEIGAANIGDRIQIIRKDLDIYYTARVFKIKRNLLNADLTSVELGDNIAYNQVTKNKELVNQIESLNNRVSEVAKSANLTFIDVLEEMREGLENSYFNQDGYNYELKVGNPYKLPAGYYSFNAPIEKNPTKVIYMGAGTMAIANKKDSTGKWQWQTFGTGDGILAEAIVGKLGEFATVNANQINVNSDFYKTAIGKKVDTKIVGMGKDLDGKITALDQKTVEGLRLVNGKLVDETGKIYENLKEVNGNIVQLDEQISEKLKIVDGKIVDEAGKIRADLKIVDGRITDETGKIRNDLKIVDGKIVEIEEKVVLKGVLYNNVKITPEKGIQVLDAQSRERLQLGNWAPGRYGLNLKDASGNRTIIDDNGILQSWQDGRCDNVDSSNPLKLHIYIPKETQRIYKAALRIYTEGFRAYSKATEWKGTQSTSTDSGGGDYTSTDGGGGDYTSTEYDGGRVETSHGSSNVQGGMQRVSVQGGTGYIEIYQTTYHEHEVDIPSHNHGVRIPGHSHGVSIPNHRHDVDIPGHGHDIVFGIYQEYVSNVRTEIYINGTDRTAAISGSGYVYGNNDEMNLTSYLKNGWNEIEVRSNGRCRVDATIFIQALLNYGGY